MGEEDEELPFIEIELNISMNCLACEKKVVTIISKINGVEMFITDMQNNRVVVKGRVIAEEVVKKLRKKTRKKVEIMVPPPPPDQSGEVNEGDQINVEHSMSGYFNGTLQSSIEGDILVQDLGFMSIVGDDRDVNNEQDYYYWCKSADDLTAIFSDENAHACSIM